MRPKLIALIAVSAVALVGCASNEIPTVTPAEQSAQQASVDAELKKSIPDPIEVAEDNFADFAETRAEVHGAKKLNREKVIDGLHDFCDAGNPIVVSSTKALNENLELIAEKEACDALD